MKPRETVLVCSRADDEYTVTGSAFDHFCSQCKARVMIAPTGKRRLEREPDIKVLCLPCAKGKWAVEEVDFEMAASPAELAHEVQNIRPNFWRKRN